MSKWLQAVPPTISVFLLAAAISQALAANPSAETEAAAHYRRCLAQAELQPEKALADATLWKQSGGGAAARHCQAAALYADGQYADAGVKLTELAEDIDAGRVRLDAKGAAQPQLAAQLRDQAGEAWLLAHDPVRALAAWDAALATRGLAADSAGPAAVFRAGLLIGRARALVAIGRYADAIQQLNAAEPLILDTGGKGPEDKERADLYLYRASARVLYGDVEEAAADIDKAAALRPMDPDILLERGNIAQARGDGLAAAADWTEVLRLAPDSDAADAARANLTVPDRADPDRLER